MQIPSRPRGASLPLAFDAADVLVAVNAKPPAPFPRRGSTSNCSSRHMRRRRHPHQSTTVANTYANRKPTTATAATDDDGDSPVGVTEPVFFVEDDNVALLSESLRATTTNASDRGARRPYGTPNRPHRSASMPLQRVDRQIHAKTARRHTDMPPPGEKMKRRKNVAFKNVHEPEIMPDTRPPVQSYDELLFNVAGLYHTLSYLHEPDYLDDGSTTDSSSSDSSDPMPPMERSMQLMIAEFLYRSAVYLGYPPEKDIWVPGFRENKKFSSNDVKRWRRLAHFDWEKEEREFAQLTAAPPTRSRASSRAPARISSRASHRTSSTLGLRATVSSWLSFGRSSSRDNSPVNSAAVAIPIKYTSAEKPLPPLMLDPPLVSSTADLTKLVEVVNYCISYGGFRFTERQIRKLCNVPIRK